MDKWHIGDPVDWGDGWMDAQNWGHGDDEGEKDPYAEKTTQDSERRNYPRRAHNPDFNYEKALEDINHALRLDKNNADNWNKKAIILESLKRYNQSEECYNRSLRLSPNNVVYENKARMLYGWAVELRDSSKKLPNGLDKLERARQIIIRAIDSLPENSRREDPERYIRVKDSIDFYIEYEGTFQKRLEILKSYPKDELFTITGIDHSKSDIDIDYGTQLKLVKEPNNESDKDAIAVYAKNRKWGYVANTYLTKYELTSSASELQDKIQNTAKGEYLFLLDRYFDIHFNVGRIIK